MMRTCMATGALMLCVTAVWAQSDPIAERRTLMKAQGAATGVGVKMIKGEEPFDAAKAREVYETYLKTTSKFARQPPTPPPAASIARRKRIKVC